MPRRTRKNQEISTVETDFITLTSHQLRTPLSGMKWLIELLKKNSTGKLNKKQREFLDKIYTSNEHVIALVNDLLEVSRLEAGETRLYFQPTDLVPIINVVIREKAAQIKKKQIKLTFTVEQEPLPLVRTEPIKIRQAMGNLLQNAITYSSVGAQVNIKIRVEGKNIVLEIQDTGAGIPKDQQSRVFTKFFRGSNVLQFESTGTGLGTYISKAFIEASGGKIWFKSQEGRGTTFYFTLPLAE